VAPSEISANPPAPWRAVAPTTDPRDGGPGHGINGLAKRSLREYGMATAATRVLPDFLVIGAKRGATTTLWDQISQHPSVPPLFPRRQRIKSVRFFSTNYARGVSWYRSFFPTRAWVASSTRHHGYSPAVGEATPYYLFHPLVPERVETIVPDVRLIAILRNPVDRAYSHYGERVRNRVESLSFEEALDAEPARVGDAERRLIDGTSTYEYAHEHFTYVAQGRYVEQLERWLERFDRSRLLVIVNEEFDRDPDGQLARVWSFLGLPPHAPITRQRLNSHPRPAMDDRTRARLLETFADDNRRLEELLDLDLEGWRR